MLNFLRISFQSRKFSSFEKTISDLQDKITKLKETGSDKTSLVELNEQIENNGKLAVRVPNNECLLSILKQCKLIVGTSANISGEESITDSHDYIMKLPEIDVLVDGGKIDSSGESTIIDFVDDGLKIIREGAVSKKEIEKLL